MSERLVQATIDWVRAQLEAEYRQLEVEYRDREQEIARRMYRRGYLAGRASQRRGAPAVTNPERHARGDAGRLLNG